MNTQQKIMFHDEFLQEDFSVDAFLQNYSGTYTLEGLRDELSRLLKSLETRMIDIVNSESDTILSLSSSLNGLDERIDSLRSSLEQLKEEVMSVLRIIEYTLKSIKNLMESKKLTNVEKRGYMNLIQAMNCCERVKSILDSDSYTRPLKSDLFLRAVDQYVLLQTHIKKCDHALLTEIERKDLVNVKHLVSQHYTESFLDAFKRNDTEELIALLQMGVLLQNQEDTEVLVRKKIVSPKLDKIINEKSLASKRLLGLYDEIFDFIASELKLLLSLTSNSKENRKNGISGYKLFINSIWLDIEEKLRINLSSIFAPGNPVVFQNRFTETMNFIKKLDQFYAPKKSLFNHPSYETHMKRWNLPIYFQICFNEVVFEYEKVLAQKRSAVYGKSEFRFALRATDAAMKSINRCLSGDVFIQQIVHKFWKLILQILSRYSTWTDEQLNKNQEDEIFEDKLKLFVSLHHDTRLLSTTINEIDLNIFPRQTRSIITSNINTCKEAMIQKLKVIETAIINTISSNSITAIKQVSHIPRLYRKTNRSVPTEPAQYVIQVLAPPKLFMNNYVNNFPTDIFEATISEICEKVTKDYVIAVDEILTQVRKTEDSLRRLKKVRQQQNADGSIGDDQKIRIQLQLDVKYYCNEVQKMNSKIDLSALKSLVKDAQ